MKILVISNSYTPRNSPRAFRWTALCEEWAKLGHEVHVVTGWEPGLEQYEIANRVNVHRVGGILDMARKWALPGDTGPQGNDSKLNNQVRVRRINVRAWLSYSMGRMLRVVYNLTWKKVYWPDFAFLWIWPAARKSRSLHKALEFNVMITVSHPFSDHIVGYILRRTYQSLGWVADSGDPFAFSEGSPSNNLVLYKRLNYWIEQKVLDATDCFTVTTDETKLLYLQHYKRISSKLHVVPPLLNPLFDQIDTDNKNVFDNDAIVMLYAGVFYRKMRSPEPLLKLISTVTCNSEILKSKLQLHVIGSPDIIIRKLERYPLLQPRVFIHGVVSHRKAINHMVNADLLVNIGNNTPYQLPSKVIEYMATGLPIVNLYSIPNDSSISALKHYPKHLNIDVHNVEMNDQIVSFIEKHSKVNASEKLSGTVDRYRLKNISKQYLTLLNEID